MTNELKHAIENAVLILTQEGNAISARMLSEGLDSELATDPALERLKDAAVEFHACPNCTVKGTSRVLEAAHEYAASRKANDDKA